MVRQSEYTAFLKSVPSFVNLQEETLIKIADVMEETEYKVHWLDYSYGTISRAAWYERVVIERSKIFKVDGTVSQRCI